MRKSKPKAEVKAKVAVFKYLVTLAAEKKQSNRHKNCSSTPGNDSFANLIYKIEKCQQHFISTSYKVCADIVRDSTNFIFEIFPSQQNS